MNAGRLDSLAARVFLLLLLGLVAAAGAAFAVASAEQRAQARQEEAYRLASRLVDSATVLNAKPRTGPPGRLGAGPESLRLVDDARAPGPLDAALTAQVNRQLAGRGTALVSRELAQGCEDAPPLPFPPRPAPPPRPPPGPPDAPGAADPAPRPAGPCRLIALTLPDGTRVRLATPPAPPPPPAQGFLRPGSLLAMALVAATLAAIVARFVTAPVERLARAALALGQDLDRPALALAGPREIRQAAAAFNTMQAHLRRLLTERTLMLAAITHDLQTPLTRQRLRIEKVADPELRDDLLADQEAMRALIREGLDLARAAHDGAEVVALDVDSLLDSLVDDAQAAGHEVTVTGTCGCVVQTRPQALARCLANLLDNAAQYAGPAELAATARGAELWIQVLDRGPGLPPGGHERLFAPFTRGEASRSRETGGVGLGLTIARLLAERSGARLSLHERPGGGLEARLVLAHHPGT